MRERKKTAVHGTLEMIPLAWKFNSKQLLSKTLNSRINIIETRAVLNIVQKDENGLLRPNGRAKFRATISPILKSVKIIAQICNNMHS